MKIPFLLVSLLIALPVLAQETTDLVPEIVVSEKSESDLRLKKYEINRVETLRPKAIEKKQAQTFAQAIDNEKGIDTQTSCAFCGAKRVTINGLKGEHTTILIDGLPLHSTVSGFYGVEAIPLGGVDSIDIYRGAGAALTVPESIGGAINIVTREIVANEREFDLSLAHDGQKNVSALATRKLSENTGLLFGVQYGEMIPLDLDKNGVAELPRQTTASALAKVSHRLNETDEISFRVSYGRLKTIGGTMTKTELDGVVPAVARFDDFQDRDVRKKFIGDGRKITDNVKLDRFEVAAIYRRQLNEDSSLKLSLGGASQDQRAIYSHGYDYDNLDRLWVALAEYQRALNDSHLLTLGLDSKNQDMDSTSDSLYRQRGLAQDDLRYRSLGGFVQDTWLIDDANELSMVLRVDQIKTSWLDLDKTLDRSVIAPRIFYKHTHDEVLTSRLGLGIGYRSPLTLFESMHGTDHEGFLIEIDRLETAQSFTYSLAGQRIDDFFEAGVHVTRLEDMAYGVDQALIAAPTLFRNVDEAYTLSAYDLSYGRRLTPHWTLEGILEIFDFPAGYKEKLPVAAVEKRLSFTSDLEWGAWTLSQRLNVVGERDLSAYGYDDHYNIIFLDEDVSSPTFEEIFPESQKRQKSPTYFTLDLTFNRTLTESLSLGLSVLNVFDYTQTGAGDSPTTWHLHGKEYHLDNFHIWGPLRGRQFFVSLKGLF
ncbi:MAG TPA: TonB-dependent receptor [Pseudobdellovibrionaceae bacterium]|nr:TonB-dependent receptor [Pseudobdellovibrionaceae bacterium]